MGLIVSAILLVLPEGIALANSQDVRTTTQISQDFDESAYVGLRYTGDGSSSLPGNLEDLGGWIIISPGEGVGSHSYSVNSFFDTTTGYFLLFFAQVVEYEGESPVFEILDAVNIPIDNLLIAGNGEIIQQGEYSVSGYRFCSINGNRDAEIVVVVRYNDTQFSSDIRQAWRANRQSEELETISADAIRCESPGWGV